MPFPDLSDNRHAFAGRVLLPTMAAVTATVFGAAFARWCCRTDLRRLDPYGIAPGSLALLTAAVALWTYLNPRQD